MKGGFLKMAPRNTTESSVTSSDSDVTTLEVDLPTSQEENHGGLSHMIRIFIVLAILLFLLLVCGLIYTYIRNLKKERERRNLKRPKPVIEEPIQLSPARDVGNFHFEL